MEESFKNSLSEVYTVIENSDIDIINKIPDNFKNFIKNNMNKDNMKANIQDSDWKNNISEDAKTILALIYRDYLISAEERNNLLYEEKIKRLEYEQILRKKYNPDNLFKNNTKITDEGKQQESTSMVEYKEKNFLQKLFDKIKHLLQK